MRYHLKFKNLICTTLILVLSSLSSQIAFCSDPIENNQIQNPYQAPAAYSKPKKIETEYTTDELMEILNRLNPYFVETKLDLANLNQTINQIEDYETKALSRLRSTHGIELFRNPFVENIAHNLEQIKTLNKAEAKLEHTLFSDPSNIEKILSFNPQLSVQVLSYASTEKLADMQQNAISNENTEHEVILYAAQILKYLKFKEVSFFDKIPMFSPSFFLLLFTHIWVASGVDPNSLPTFTKDPYGFTIIYIMPVFAGAILGPLSYQTDTFALRLRKKIKKLEEKVKESKRGLLTIDPELESDAAEALNLKHCYKIFNY